MSATICWEINKESENTLDVNCPSGFVESMTKAFGKMPWYIHNDNVLKLHGMHAMGFEEASEIIQLLYKFESIKIWVEY